MDSIFQTAILGLASLPVTFALLFGQSVAVLESANELELAQNMMSLCDSQPLSRAGLAENSGLGADHADRLAADVKTICQATSALGAASQPSN